MIYMVCSASRNVTDKTKADALTTADLTLPCVRSVLFCLCIISVKRGCLNVPGEGLAPAGCDEGVEGAVCIGVGSAFDSAEPIFRTGVGTREVAVEDMVAKGRKAEANQDRDDIMKDS